MRLSINADPDQHGMDIEIALRSLIRTMATEHKMPPDEIARAIRSCRSSIVEMAISGTIDSNRANEIDEVVVRLTSEQEAMLPREHEHREPIP